MTDTTEKPGSIRETTTRAILAIEDHATYLRKAWVDGDIREFEKHARVIETAIEAGRELAMQDLYRNETAGDR